jgi:ABC-2 type transport system permease protein
VSTSSRRRVTAMVRRNLLVQRRNPGHWFLLIVLPLVDGLLFGSIGVAFGEGEAPVQLLVTGIMLFHLIWQLTLAGSLGLLEEVWSSNLMNLIATPLTEREFMASLGVVGLIRTVVSVSVIATVGLVFYSVAPDSAGWVLVPSAAILLLFGWAITLFVVGMTLQYGDSAEVFSWGTLVLLMPLAGVFYPIESLPTALQAVARVIPLTHVFDAVRQGLEDSTVAWGQLAIAAAGTVVMLGLALWFLDHQLGRFRSEGWVTRFT